MQLLYWTVRCRSCPSSQKVLLDSSALENSLPLSYLVTQFPSPLTSSTPLPLLEGNSHPASRGCLIIPSSKSDLELLIDHNSFVNIALDSGGIGSLPYALIDRPHCIPHWLDLENHFECVWKESFPFMNDLTIAL